MNHYTKVGNHYRPNQIRQSKGYYGDLSGLVDHIKDANRGVGVGYPLFMCYDPYNRSLVYQVDELVSRGHIGKINAIKVRLTNRVSYLKWVMSRVCRDKDRTVKQLTAIYLKLIGKYGCTMRETAWKVLNATILSKKAVNFYFRHGFLPPNTAFY